MKPSRRVTVRPGDRPELERLAHLPSTPQKIAARARIILLSEQGVATGKIAERLGVSVPMITFWRDRYEAEGAGAIARDRPRSGRPKVIGPEKVAEIVDRARFEKPVASTHWSTRTMAAEVGVSPATVRRIWKLYKLKPHRTRTFKVSTDPELLDKVDDVVGLYLDPPEKAVVFSVDEKSQIQALDRTQPGLPMKPGRCGTMTHDYKRHGTTTLFAALNVATGEVVGECMSRHRHDEFLTFLRKLHRQVPRELDLHVIVDNYATHKHVAVTDWLTRHRRVHLHFTPTSSSWLNQVERFFAEITDKAIRRGVFRSVHELEEAIMAFLAHRNEHPTPYTWTASVEAIMEKIDRARTALKNVTQTHTTSAALH
jgi:transposase